MTMAAMFISMIILTRLTLITGGMNRIGLIAQEVGGDIIIIGIRGGVIIDMPEIPIIGRACPIMAVGPIMVIITIMVIPVIMAVEIMSTKSNVILDAGRRIHQILFELPYVAMLELAHKTWMPLQNAPQGVVPFLPKPVHQQGHPEAMFQQVQVLEPG